MNQQQSKSSPVCFAVTSLALTGGVERDAIKSIRAFGEQGRAVHVVAGFVRPGVKDLLHDLPITWHAIYSFVRPPSLSQLLIYLQAKRIIARIKAQTPALSVISFEPNPLADYWVGASPQALWKAAKKRGRFSRSFKPGLGLWQHWAEQRLCAHASHILTYGSLAQEWFLRHDVAAERLTQVIIPTDLNLFAPTPPALNERREILIIGTNPRLKGVDIALRAWKTISQHYPELTLRIVCKGWKVPALVKSSGGSNIEISPFIPSPETYYAKARLVLMPSMYESWGNVPLEALACGVPVVVSKQTPSSMVVTDPVLGATIDRDGQRDDDKLAEAVLAQLAAQADASAMQARHHHIATFQHNHQTTLDWLLAHV
ncbi:MAG: glycosyltransferase family 4 protein [Mariprofundales bacterium]